MAEIDVKIAEMIKKGAKFPGATVQRKVKNTKKGEKKSK